MTLPVSSYEELLNRVRSLTHETRQLQRQIDAPLLDHNENERQINSSQNVSTEWSFKPRTESYSTLDSSLVSTPPPITSIKDVGTRWTKEQGASPEAKEQEETSTTHTNERGVKLIGNQNPMCHSTATANTKQQTMCEGGLSYSYSYSSEQLGTKVEMVYNLLSMLGTHDRAEMTSTLLAMSSSPDSCRAMRQSGCLSLLVQLVHSSGESSVVRQRAAQALRNMVLCHGDDKRGRREARVLRLLDQIITYTDLLQDDPQPHTEESHPGPAIAALMKLSFDEEHRLAMCQLGALYVVARLVQVEAGYSLDCCITVKRYAGMALTNLTFGDGNNKALLCSMKPFMTALVSQLSSSSEDLTQVTASVLRNLSWRADAASKQALREVGSVSALMKAAMGATREATLKSVLSALWNLSAHCNINKVDICAVEGALQYIVEMLNYQSASKTLAVVENAGGILRNISSHIAVREDYRKMLREHNCLAILLRQLQSASLTVVSNACGTLWNLSARCSTDQRALVALGAVPMLTSLAHSRHRMIAMGASAALKNLLPVRLAQQQHLAAASGGATLSVRKRRALEAELNSSLSETCDNIEPSPNWEPESPDVSTNQVKENCDQINHSMQQLTLEETTEQPVNYSLKYCENDKEVPQKSAEDKVTYTVNYKEEEQNEEPKTYVSPCFPEKVDPQSDYAETDLDQLTDYSLRYTEEEHQDQDKAECNENGEKTAAGPSPPPPDNSVSPSIDASPGKLDSGKVTNNLETPLMFSRSSSLGSLNSCEPNYDGHHSSRVSEFSRMTSGVLSPSELPDSPTGTVPPSPRVKALPQLPKEAVDTEKTRTAGVFEDTVVAFKEESTPAQFSTATSLSDLTFDDDAHDTNCERKDLELAAVCEEEDEHVLADCINIGMQNNGRGSLETINTGSSTRIRRATGIPVKTSSRSSQHMEEMPMQFCTEDTPASLSNATSQSELDVELSDTSCDNILADCIQSGMQAQPKQLPIGKKIGGEQTGGGNVDRSEVKAAPPSSSRGPVSIPPPRMRQLLVEDELSVFATEGSPVEFSNRSSLSDLTINSFKPDIPSSLAAGRVRWASAFDVRTSSSCYHINSGLKMMSSHRKRSPTVLDQQPVTTVSTERPYNLRVEAQPAETSPISSLDPEGDEVEEVTVLSATSGDEETLQDQDLLLQVISSGMPTVGGDQMKESTDTWAEESDRGDLSFPSLSVPRSLETEEEPRGEEDPTLTESRVIRLEAGRVALISHLEMEASFTRLDQTQPPSNMASIISLSSSASDHPRKEFRLLQEDESLPDLQSEQPPSGMDSILSLTCSLETTDRKKAESLLENVKPPTELDDLLDLDNSILSVASLTSEVAEDSLTLEATPPQQRRQHSLRHRKPNTKLRYNTYVIKSEKKQEGAIEKPPEEEEAKVEEAIRNEAKDKKERITPKQRRQADRERFRTRTIHDLPPSHVERLSSVESEGSTPPDMQDSGTSEPEETPRPVVVKPPEVKSIRGGGRTSSIPVVRSPVKSNPGGAKKKAAPGSIQRQGTFTKEETVSAIPVPVSRKPASPLRKIPIGASKSTGNCSTGIGSGRGRAASLPNKSGGSGGVRTSVSNQSLKSACQQEGGGRWASNSSLNNQPSSKIASLWKRVDEAKKKQPVKDTRLWVPPEPNSKQVA